ncbi:hypothetical protein C8J57DRAFT_1346944 [Mycena rebaudengoi]|nr:hypothetical protein C8J57DRAFT_1346944 [Mycena rebaudengoi]
MHILLGEHGSNPRAVKSKSELTAGRSPGRHRRQIVEQLGEGAGCGIARNRSPRLPLPCSARKSRIVHATSRSPEQRRHGTPYQELGWMRADRRLTPGGDRAPFTPDIALTAVSLPPSHGSIHAQGKRLRTPVRARCRASTTLRSRATRSGAQMTVQSFPGTEIGKGHTHSTPSMGPPHPVMFRGRIHHRPTAATSRKYSQTRTSSTRIICHLTTSRSQ